MPKRQENAHGTVCREKKTVNYNEHAFFKAAEQALEDTKPKRR